MLVHTDDYETACLWSHKSHILWLVILMYTLKYLSLNITVLWYWGKNIANECLTK